LAISLSVSAGPGDTQSYRGFKGASAKTKEWKKSQKAPNVAHSIHQDQPGREQTPIAFSGAV